MARLSKAREEIACYEADREEFDLAPAVTPQQWRQLAKLKYAGPTPSTKSQASHIIAKMAMNATFTRTYPRKKEDTAL